MHSMNLSPEFSQTLANNVARMRGTGTARARVPETTTLPGTPLSLDLSGLGSNLEQLSLTMFSQSECEEVVNATHH